MGELSEKDRGVLDFLLDCVNTEIFTIEQEERESGKLDYSLCSDENEKQIITTKKIQKFKKRISKCNPIIAGYLNALTTPDPLNTEFEEKREIITKNFLLTEYYELFEDLLTSDLQNFERYKFASVIKSMGYDYKPLKDFIQGVCDVNSFYLYKSFLDIPQDHNLDYDTVVNKLNNAFFKLEAFMAGTIKNYKHFDFNTAFTELFYVTRKEENFTYDNCKRIGQYWDLTEQIRVDYDQSDFENIKAYDNRAFNIDCNQILSINYDRLEEFTSFATPDEIEEQTKKKSVANLMKPTAKSAEVVKVESKATEIKVPSEENPYPRIFTSINAFYKFRNLLDEFGNGAENVANYSFVFHKMKRDRLIFDDYQQTQFIYFLLNFDINISRIKPKSQLGKTELRESIYNKV